MCAKGFRAQQFRLPFHSETSPWGGSHRDGIGTGPMIVEHVCCVNICVIWRGAANNELGRCAPHGRRGNPEDFPGSAVAAPWRSDSRPMLLHSGDAYRRLWARLRRRRWELSGLREVTLFWIRSQSSRPVDSFRGSLGRACWPGRAPARGNRWHEDCGRPGIRRSCRAREALGAARPRGTWRTVRRPTPKE